MRQRAWAWKVRAIKITIVFMLQIGLFAMHILEVMESFHASARAGRKMAIKSHCRQPEPLPPGLPPGHLA